MLPVVVNQSLIHPFVYWNQGPCRGMRYGRELYTLIRQYSIAERFDAYTRAADLAEQGTVVCITVSKQGYAIWLSLRSLSFLQEQHPLRRQIVSSVTEAPLEFVV